MTGEDDGTARAAPGDGRTPIFGVTAGRPELVTPRLRLRRPVTPDVPAIVAIVGRAEVARCLARVPHPYRAEDAAFFLDRIVPAEWVWAITPRGNDRLIGAVGLTPEGSSSAELGYWLSPRHWGRGLMTEAAGAVVRFGFDTLGLSRITSGHFEHNPASGRVLRKLGFAAIGRVSRSCLAEGADLPSIVMWLDRDAAAG